MMTIPDSLKTARKVSTPLLGFSTADQWATMEGIKRSYEAEKRIPPIVQWDCCRGFLPVNSEGQTAIAAILPDNTFPGQTPGLNLIEALVMMGQLPKSSIVFLLNAQRFFNEPAVIQGVLNLRELFKENQRTLVLLGPVLQLPIELQQDVMTFDEPLPTEAEIRRIVVEQVGFAREAAKDIPEPDAETLRGAVAALSGLPAFPVEQSTAMALAASRRLDVPALWARKKAFVAQTKGLTFDSSIETFADVGGLDAAKEHAADIFGGRLPPRAIIRIDEIEKHMAGASGPVADSSGVSQDLLGLILRTMEDEQWRGMLTVGPPGSGKSIYTKTMGQTFNVPTLELDLGALKGSLVGQSEENGRTAMKVIKAIAGAGAYLVATCNKLDVLPPELRRRFVHGIWFFDLPTRAELDPIWRINLKRWELCSGDVDADALAMLLELSAGWTGAEVRNVCRLAYETGKSVEKMMDRIVPVSKSDPDSIDRLRRAASGKFLSASVAGPYRHPADVAAPAGKTKRGFMES
jgi:hypothetical protein